RFPVGHDGVPAARPPVRAALSRGHAARLRARAAPPGDAAGLPLDRTSCRRLLLEKLRGIIGRDTAVGELAKDLLATLRLAIGLSLRWKAEGADHRVKTRTHGRVAHPELALHV